MSIKYENFNLKKFWGNFIIYSNSADSFHKNITILWRENETGLFSECSFARRSQIPLLCIPFALNFFILNFIILSFVLNKLEDNIKLNI